MRPLLALVALLGACAAASVASGRTAAGCSLSSARDAVLASSLPQRWQDEAVHKYGRYEGLTRVVCGDFTRDGQTDMAAVFFSGGTAGDVAWVAFRRVGAAWKLELSRLREYKLGLKAAGGDLVETQPVYLKGDANCCPSGGYDHVRFHWNGTRFLAARRWHTATFSGY